MNTPKTIYLNEYQTPEFFIPKVDLRFDLYNEHTIVRSKLEVESNRKTPVPLKLNGEKLELRALSVNGKVLSENEYSLDSEYLTITETFDKMTVEIETKIDPENNKALEGLYKSDGIFCTQNEPEGFRKMTYYLDRPDVMSSYTTTITADKSEYPILLSNGNKIDSGDVENGRHFATWEDPFKKPTYLFALVAGDLGCVKSTFITQSGRSVALEIYVDKGNENRTAHAMQSLKNAMKWDEDRFGLEYDLDVYMIVAVDAFNFGAMENKGLNVFNSKYVLADNISATDDDFLGIENVIGHEYFHNWTGNRVTCRDWFQLTLKEGLTVFRDEEFSSDMNSRSVKRIEDVRYLKNIQFVEDSGPTTHPIRPESYIEINNFYTGTVYNKGAEIIRMIHTFIGEERFQKGIRIYFENFDGKAVTTEDFLWAMEHASGFDFTGFKHWYTQAGTPHVSVHTEFNATEKTYKITFKQTCKQTPETKSKKPFTFPVRMGLISKSGNELSLNSEGERETILTLSKAEETFTFLNISEQPIPSLFRGFSAPIKMENELTVNEKCFLLAHDTDEFNRYEAGQELAFFALQNLISQIKSGAPKNIDPAILQAFHKIMMDHSLDASFRAEVLNLPSITELTEEMNICDFDAAFVAREHFTQTFASEFQSSLNKLYRSLSASNKDELDPVSVGNRRLKNRCLTYLSSTGNTELLWDHYHSATNMTDKIAGLSLLCDGDSAEKQKALDDFYTTWKHDTLVMNKWFMVQAGAKHITAENVKVLEQDPAFDLKNPNKLRSLFGVFMRNLTAFHSEDGSGYTWVADRVIDIDAFNGSAAASLVSAFKKYKSLDTNRKSKVKAELKRILAIETLTKDTYEMASKILDN